MSHPPLLPPAVPDGPDFYLDMRPLDDEDLRELDAALARAYNSGVVLDGAYDDGGCGYGAGCEQSCIDSRGLGEAVSPRLSPTRGQSPVNLGPSLTSSPWEQQSPPLSTPTEEYDPHNCFVHNGLRYDGDIFELRPPGERTIASRPNRVLEHVPALLNHRQAFNRIYSEATYSMRPASLRARPPSLLSDRSSVTSAIVAGFGNPLGPAFDEHDRRDAAAADQLYSGNAVALQEDSSKPGYDGHGLRWHRRIARKKERPSTSQVLKTGIENTPPAFHSRPPRPQKPAPTPAEDTVHCFGLRRAMLQKKHADTR
jgi:hypothetical protein